MQVLKYNSYVMKEQIKTHMKLIKILQLFWNLRHEKAHFILTFSQQLVYIMYQLVQKLKS